MTKNMKNQSQSGYSSGNCSDRSGEQSKNSTQSKSTSQSKNSSSSKNRSTSKNEMDKTTSGNAYDEMDME